MADVQSTPILPLRTCSKCGQPWQPTASNIRHRDHVCRSCRRQGAKSHVPKRAAYRSANHAHILLYAIWRGMRLRCSDPRAKSYPLYGGRGIRVCERWEHSFEAFREDMGGRPSRLHQIDRIDNDGPYSPENCRWATAQEQARNRGSNRVIEFRGEKRTLEEWAQMLNITHNTLAKRLDKWPLERAMTESRNAHKATNGKE